MTTVRTVALVDPVIVSLRERLAAVLDPMMEVFTAADGLPAIRTRSPGALADAILDALGLERVGMRNPRSGSVHAVLTCGRTHAHRDCEPVYRLASQSGRSESGATP